MAKTPTPAATPPAYYRVELARPFPADRPELFPGHTITADQDTLDAMTAAGVVLSAVPVPAGE